MRLCCGRSLLALPISTHFLEMTVASLLHSQGREGTVYLKEMRIQMRSSLDVDSYPKITKESSCNLWEMDSCVKLGHCIL